MDIYYIKQRGVLIPFTDEDQEKHNKLKQGEAIKAKIVNPRNVLFHKKFFKLIEIAFNNWTPIPELQQKYKGIIPQKNVKRFRKDVTIWAGYSEAFYRADSSVRLEAKSISFANMKQDEFEKLYSAVINVVLERFCQHYTDYDLRQQVEQEILNFA